MIYLVNPCAKPRMTISDKWKQRPCVMRYRAFKDECRLRGVQVPEDGCKIVFYIPMPKSWSKKKKKAMNNQPHRVRPDIDNLIKALLDAVYTDDSTVWQISVKKLWSTNGSIMII